MELSKRFTGIKIQCDDQGKVVKKIQYANGEVVAEYPGAWIRLNAFEYERKLDITDTDVVFQHGSRDTNQKDLKIIPTFTYSRKRSQMTEVRPYTAEMRAQAKKQEGRSTFQFADNKTVCVLPSAKFYKKPGMMRHLDRTYA